MALFDIQAGEIQLNPDVLAVPTFKRIWERDSSGNKERAKREISYVVFMKDYKSPYRTYPEFNGERRKAVLEDLYKGVGRRWNPDELVEEALVKYERLQETTNSRLLKKAKIAADKLADYFENVDFNVTDENTGKPVYSARDVASNLKMIGDIVKSLNSLEKIVQAEQAEGSSARGGSEIGEYELDTDWYKEQGD